MHSQVLLTPLRTEITDSYETFCENEYPYFLIYFISFYLFFSIFREVHVPPLRSVSEKDFFRKKDFSKKAQSALKKPSVLRLFSRINDDSALKHAEKSAIPPTTDSLTELPTRSISFHETMSTQSSVASARSAKKVGFSPLATAKKRTPLSSLFSCSSPTALNVNAHQRPDVSVKKRFVVKVKPPIMNTVNKLKDSLRHNTIYPDWMIELKNRILKLKKEARVLAEIAVVESADGILDLPPSSSIRLSRALSIANERPNLLSAEVPLRSRLFSSQSSVPSSPRLRRRASITSDAGETQVDSKPRALQIPSRSNTPDRSIPLHPPRKVEIDRPQKSPSCGPACVATISSLTKQLAVIMQQLEQLQESHLLATPIRSESSGISSSISVMPTLSVSHAREPAAVTDSISASSTTEALPASGESLTGAPPRHNNESLFSPSAVICAWEQSADNVLNSNNTASPSNQTDAPDATLQSVTEKSEN